MRNFNNHGFAILGVSFALAFLFSLLSFCMRTPPDVYCATITPNINLSGRIEWIEDLPANSIGFKYAILYIDGEARSINNELPLRFDLDTNKLSNGSHILKVVFYDANTQIGESPKTSIIVKNATAVSKDPVQELQPLPVDTVPAMPIAPAVPVIPAQRTVPSVKTQGKKGIIILFRDKPLDFLLAPYEEHHRVMTLLRPLTIAAGGSLKWNGYSGTTTINRHTVRFTINSRIAIIDGRKVQLARPVVVRQDRVFAPVCLWRDLFKGPTEYDPKSRSIILGDIGIAGETAN